MKRINEINTDDNSFKKRRRFMVDEKYNKYRIMNQASQVLNYSSNVYFDKENLVDIVRIYNEILDDGNIDFKNSLNNTRKLLEADGLNEYDEFIRKYENNSLLENNNRDSFIILPMFSDNHAFYGVLRKIDDKYNFTIVNRGDRSSYGQYEEVIINDDKFPDFINFLKGVSSQNSNITTYAIYVGVSVFSSEYHTLRVESQPQKVGNCFIKELESAIRYAKWSRDKNIEELRNSKEPMNPKWNISNKEMHRRYIEKLKSENIDLSDKLGELFDLYAINKDIRDVMRINAQNKKELTLDDLKGIYKDSENALKDFLKTVDIYNFRLFKDEIIKMVKDNGTPEENKQIDDIAKLYSNLVYKYTYKRITDKSLEAYKDNFANLANQLKEGYANMYYTEALNSYIRKNTDESLELLESTLKLCPDYAYAYALRSDIEMADRDYKNALIDIEKAIELQPDVTLNYERKAKILKTYAPFDEYVDMVNKLLDMGIKNKEFCVDISESYVMKGKYDNALEWLKKAQNIDANDTRCKFLEQRILRDMKGKDRTL